MGGDEVSGPPSAPRGASPRGGRALSGSPRRSGLCFWCHDRFLFPLPSGHRFPLGKYRLLRERVVAEGLASLADIRESGRVSWRDLGLVHAPEHVERVRWGTLTRREEQALGLPWSPELVERARRSTRGTVEAARDAVAWGLGMNLGGGTHHAGRDAARGFCLVNDVAVAVAVLRRDGDARRVLVVDCDVHQGDGTAGIFAADPLVFTLSLHGARNYPFTRVPSDLDVDLPSGTGDGAYLEALSDALERALPRARPEVVFYLAGADPWEGDRLGRLRLTKPGLRARDDLVLQRVRAAGAATCVVLAGGYADDVRDTVDINLGTVRAVLAAASGTARAA
jgi:acetoin utilization deacetylase AcuC-like enzyme